MRLERLETRDDATFDRISEITSYCFSGPERPPDLALRNVFDNGEVFVWWDDKRIIAYAIATVDTGEPYIWSIGTVPAYRRTGYASALIDCITGYYGARHEPSIALTVNVNNPAQKLYFDKGFRVVKFIPRRYRDVAGLRMRRNLL